MVFGTNWHFDANSRIDDVLVLIGFLMQMKKKRFDHL